MNTPEQFVQALTFARPDRVPFTPGWPRESTLAAWRTQGLPAGADWLACLLEALGLEGPPPAPPPDLGADFRMVPQFQEKVLDRRDGHLIVQDWKGNICEISDRYDVSYLRTARDFVTRRWLSCPVQTPRDWRAMRARYELDAPGRFPADFPDRCRAAAARPSPLQVCFPGPFWQMREWCGLEALCLLMIDQPRWVDEMAAFWGQFVAGMLARVLGRLTPDGAMIMEDMAYKGRSMISPAMVRRFCMPCWRLWCGQLAASGVPVTEVDSDGYVGELVPLWIEAGANVCSPMEVAAGCRVEEFRARFGRAMAYRGGVDKRCIARGGLTLHRELDRIEPVVADGGYIPSCDHGVPSDVSWPNFVDYARRLARITGWL